MDEFESSERRKNIVLSGSAIPAFTSGELVEQVVTDALKSASSHTFTPRILLELSG